MRVSDDTTMGTHSRHSGSEASQRVAAAGGEEGRCRVESRGFWVDKSVVDQEERPRERGRAEEKRLEKVPQDERPERVRRSTQTQQHQCGSEGVSLQGLNLSLYYGVTTEASDRQE